MGTPHSDPVLWDILYLCCSWTGIRDDITFLLEEELSNVMLCSLHCEMRNTEQLLGSLGLLAHQASSLEDLNDLLSRFGPESFKQKRISIKKNPGQETCIEKNNINVATFSGMVNDQAEITIRYICANNS